MSYFFDGVSNGDPPSFVWAIIFILFTLDSTFAINMYLQQKEVRKLRAGNRQQLKILASSYLITIISAQIGKWQDYIYGEYAYIVLSLSAKFLLAWIN